MDDERRYYYVSQLRDSSVRLLFGPFDTHEEALSAVDLARGYVIARDPWSEFDAFGTVSMVTNEPGLINKYMESISP